MLFVSSSLRLFARTSRVALAASLAGTLTGVALAADHTDVQPAAEGDERTFDGLTWRFETSEWLEERSANREATRAEPTQRFLFDAVREEEKASRSLVSKLLGTKKFTSEGMWVVVDVDEEQLPPVTRASEAEDASEQEDTDGPTPDPAIEQWPVDGELVEWTPYSWTGKDCPPPDGDTRVNVWNGESRSLANMSFIRPKTTVRVVFNAPDGNFHLCTGVVIRDDWVLTAAHCLFDSNDSVPTTGELYVYKPWESGTQRFADSYFINQDYTPIGADYDDDYALIKLDFGLVGPDMDLSDHSTTVLQGVGANFHSLQIPGWTLNSADICTDWGTQVLTSSNNDITAFQSIRLRWKGDISQGASGAPLYFCPAGSNSVCGSGETGHVVSILAGFNGVYNRAVGPRVSEWFDWAQTIMNTN